MSAVAVQPRRARRQRRIGAKIAGVTGEILITAGVLVGLFVVWQWFWTDFIALREQAVMLQELPWEPPAPVVALPVLERRTDPPIDPRPADEEIFGQMWIPRFGADWTSPLAGGTDRVRVLDRLGVGLFEDAAMPGEVGNFATAGHRTTFGRPYHLIAELQEGDPIIIRTESTWFVYRVFTHMVDPGTGMEITSPVIVLPNQVDVVAPIPGLQDGELLPELTQRYMTLVSCHPIGSARERIIVHAVFDFWMPVEDGIPQLLIDAGVFANPEGMV
ncbi:MAG: class E sortase [Promicromonosporaceae bacterium]|nr:class E sortase [Promicromonosporaceae bacterium]